MRATFLLTCCEGKSEERNHFGLVPGPRQYPHCRIVMSPARSICPQHCSSLWSADWVHMQHITTLEDKHWAGNAAHLQYLFLRCPTTRLRCFPSSNSPSQQVSMDVARVYNENVQNICEAFIFSIILLTSLLHYIVVLTQTQKQLSTSLYVKMMKNLVSLIYRAINLFHS